jgi:hypothetical protein
LIDGDGVPVELCSDFEFWRGHFLVCDEVVR